MMKRFCFLIFLFLSPLLVQAQQSKQVVGIHTGLSWAGVFTNLANHYNVIADVDATTSPILDFTYDRKLNKRISVGGAIARQTFSLRYRNYEYKDQGGDEHTDNFRTDISRLQIGVRGLFYFVSSGKTAMYSGLRAGIAHWAVDTSAKDPKYDVSKYLNKYLNYALGATPSVQLILFGFQRYLTPHVGVDLEAAIGAPYFISFGLAYGW